MTSARLTSRLADVERQLKHTTEAHARIKKAMDIFNQLVKAEDRNLDYRLYQARTMNSEGVIYDDERRNDLALPIFEENLKSRTAKRRAF